MDGWMEGGLDLRRGNRSHRQNRDRKRMNERRALIISFLHAEAAAAAGASFASIPTERERERERERDKERRDGRVNGKCG